MKLTYSEAAFNICVAVTVMAGAGLYILGGPYETLPVALISLAPVAAGSWLLAPAGHRLVAGLIGSITVGLGTLVFPRIDGVVPTAVLIGVVLIIAFVALRITAFDSSQTVAS